MLTDDLADLFNETVIAVPGVLDGYGTWVASGQTIAMPCRIEGSTVVVTDRDSGREIVSRVQVFVGGYYGLDVATHRFTLPSRFVPSGQLRAVDIEKVVDEDGPCYERVLLP